MLLSAHVPLSIAAKFCVRFFFIFSLSSTFGKYSFALLPLVVCVQFLCHFFTLYIYIQGVPRGMCQTSGECSLC